MAVTENLHTGNGSKTNYSFTFPYLKTTDIKASVDGTVVTNFTAGSPTATEIQFNTAPANNAAIRIYRDTATENLSATFYAGSAIKSEDLNDNFLQNLYVTQEAKRDSGAAWQDGDDTIHSTETWQATDDTKIATTKAIENRVDTKIDSALTDDVIPGSSIQIQDDTPASGKITVNVIAATGSNSGSMSAADKSKLDGIDTGAKDDQTASEIKTLLQSSKLTGSEIANDAINGDRIADDSINSEHYVDASIDHVHLANDIIDGDNIQDDVINSEHYAAGSIDTEHIGNGQVTHDKLDNDCIDGDNIQDDVVDSEHIAAGALDLEHYASGSIDATKLSAATVVTNAEQAASGYSGNDSSFFTTSAADARYFNISSGDTIKDGQAFPDNDTTIATTAAINDRILDLVDEVGGFVPIANETSFPTANPDPENGTGTIVSIQALASNLTSNGSGVATIANAAGSGVTVTINGLANSTTYAATFGMLVETTATTHTYKFHRQVPKATEVTTVAGNTTNINTVAGNNTNINTVAGISSNVTTVAGISSNVTSVADNNTNITTVAGNNTNINTVAGANSNISTVATNITNVNTVGGAISNVNTVATNISSVNDFAARYRVASTAPTSSLDTGDLYFDTTGNELKVYNGSAWQGGVTATGNLLSKAGDQMTGNLTFSGTQTVDGRDLSVDGTKLDGIASNANNYTHPNHTGEVTSSADGAQTITDNVVDEANLKVSNSPTNGYFLSAQSGNTGGLTWAAVSTDLSGDTSPQLGGDLDVNSKNIILGDSSDADTNDVIKFGAGTDLKIYSDGTRGKLIGDVDFEGDFRWSDGSAADALVWNETTNNLEFKDNNKLTFGDGTDLSIYSDGTEGILNIPDGGTLKVKDGTNNLVTFSGASNQVDFHNDVVFVGAASNGAWDKSASKFLGNLTGTADVATEVTVTANDSTDETVYPVFVDGATGSQGAETDTGLTYNPSTGLFTSIGFSGSGASLTALNADNISSGTIAAARVPTLNQSTTGTSGGFTAGNASNLNSGTLPDARFPSTLPAISGANLTNLPASGGTFTATASGALTNGKGVVMNSNGTVSHPTATAASWGNANGNLNITSAFNVVPAGNNKFIVCNKTHSGSYRSLTAVKINDDNSITFGATVVPWSKAMDQLLVAYNPDDEMGIVTAPGGSTYWYYEHMKQFTLGGTNGLTITLGSEYNPIGTSFNNKSEYIGSSDLLYIGSNTYAWIYKRAGTNHLRCRLLANNTSSPSSNPSATSYQTIQSNNMSGSLDAVWNPDTSSIAIAHTSTESSGTLKLRSIQVGTYNSFSVSSNISTLSLATGQSFYAVCIAYDSNNQSYFVVHMKPNGWASGQQQLHGVAVNVVSGSFSAGTVTDMTTSGDIMYIDQSKNCLNYNTTSDTLLAITSFHGTTNKFKVKEVTISGTGANPSFSLSADTVISTSHNSESPSIRASTGSDKWLIGYRPTSTTTSWLSRTPASTTLTSDKYVGFADGSFSNGATATVQLPNTVVDSLSGLTAGSKYFVGGDGTPVTTDSYGKNVTAGLALSSSTLLLK